MFQNSSNMKTVLLISEIRLKRVKLSNRCGGNSDIIFQKTDILTYNLAITQSFPVGVIGYISA